MKKSTKSKAELAAGAVRIITVPPVMVTVLVILLAVKADGVFESPVQIFMMLLSLAVLPVVAYPVSYLVPSIREKGREGQRDLAFYISAAGYVAGWIFGLCVGVGAKQMVIYSTYLVSLVFLLVFNKLLHLRASGHASSVAGPIVVSINAFGLTGALVGLPLFALCFWASVTAKRHTAKEFLFGALTSVAAFALVQLVFLI